MDRWNPKNVPENAAAAGNQPNIANEPQHQDTSTEDNSNNRVPRSTSSGFAPLGSIYGSSGPLGWGSTTGQIGVPPTTTPWPTTGPMYSTFQNSGVPMNPPEQSEYPPRPASQMSASLAGTLNPNWSSGIFAHVPGLNQTPVRSTTHEQNVPQNTSSCLGGPMWGAGLPLTPSSERLVPTMTPVVNIPLYVPNPSWNVETPERDTATPMVPQDAGKPMRKTHRPPSSAGSSVNISKTSEPPPRTMQGPPTTRSRPYPAAGTSYPAAGTSRGTGTSMQNNAFFPMGTQGQPNIVLGPIAQSPGFFVIDPSAGRGTHHSSTPSGSMEGLSSVPSTSRGPLPSVPLSFGGFGSMPPPTAGTSQNTRGVGSRPEPASFAGNPPPTFKELMEAMETRPPGEAIELMQKFFGVNRQEFDRISAMASASSSQSPGSPTGPHDTGIPGFQPHSTDSMPRWLQDFVKPHLPTILQNMFLQGFDLTKIQPPQVATPNVPLTMPPGMPMGLPMGLPVGLPMGLPMGIPMGIPVGIIPPPTLGGVVHSSTAIHCVPRGVRPPDREPLIIEEIVEDDNNKTPKKATPARPPPAEYTTKTESRKLTESMKTAGSSKPVEVLDLTESPEPNVSTPAQLPEMGEHLKMDEHVKPDEDSGPTESDTGEFSRDTDPSEQPEVTDLSSSLAEDMTDQLEEEEEDYEEFDIQAGPSGLSTLAQEEDSQPRRRSFIRRRRGTRRFSRAGHYAKAKKFF